MTHRYFLGANSRKGFVSLYEDFPPDAGAFLHILKSGPGTGKSGFMRRIGREAEARGLDVHYVLCSGDPDSLDGIYLPALKQAWVDGTAPHVIEPKIFGADSDYVNLGIYFHGPFDETEKGRLHELQSAYRAHYGKAYELLSACPEQKADHDPGSFPFAVLEALPDHPRHGSITRRFLNAITCKGILHLEEDLQTARTLRSTPEQIAAISAKLPETGLDGVLCLSPLDSGRPEALWIPEAGVALTALFEPIPEEDPNMQRALDELRTAKSLHDEMESLYLPHMDFPALDAYTRSVIDRLFSA